MKTFVTVLLLAGLAAAGAGGALLGVRLGERASEPGHDVLTLTTPDALAEPPEGVLRSQGGFTGFGVAPLLSGEVVRVGAVEEAASPAAEPAGAPEGTPSAEATPGATETPPATGTPQAEGTPGATGTPQATGTPETPAPPTFAEIRVAGPDGALHVRYLAPLRLLRIVPLASALSPGDVVVVRYEGDEATGLLRLPPDLEEGTGAGLSPRQRSQAESEAQSPAAP